MVAHDLPLKSFELEVNLDPANSLFADVNAVSADHVIGPLVISMKINVPPWSDGAVTYTPLVKTRCGGFRLNDFQLEVTVLCREDCDLNWRKCSFCSIYVEDDFGYYEDMCTNGDNRFCDDSLEPCCSCADLISCGYIFGDDKLRFHIELASDLWLGEPSELPDGLTQMWKDMLFTDMHLVSKQGDEISCHRAVLCGVSSVFQAMLTGEFKEASHGEVIVHEAKAADIRAFLEFVYTGYLPCTEDYGSLLQVLRMADMYDIPALAEVCAARLLLLIDDGNVTEAVKALNPYLLSEGNLSRYSKALVELLQVDTSLLLALMSNVQLGASLDCSHIPMQGVPFACDTAQPNAFLKSLPAIEETVEPQTMDSELEARVLPLLRPESHQYVEIHVIKLPLAPPGLAFEQIEDVESPNPLIRERRVNVLCFNGCTKAFSSTLRMLDVAKELLAQGVDVQPSWANGAKVFVESLSPDILEPLLKVDSLRPWHVIVRAEDEADVIDAIGRAWRAGEFRSRCPRARKACTKHLVLQPCSSAVKVSDANSSREEAADSAQDRRTAPEQPGLAIEKSVNEQPITRDRAGTIHYCVTPSLSPRSIVTAPP